MIDQRKNEEGYLDLTAYEAIKHIEADDRKTGVVVSDSDRKDLDAYIKKKLLILVKDFLVAPTVDEINKLKEQRTVEGIDRYCRKILQNHWEQEE